MSTGFRKVVVSAGLVAILASAATFIVIFRETAPDSHVVAPSADQRINEFF